MREPYTRKSLFYTCSGSLYDALTSDNDDDEDDDDVDILEWIFIQKRSVFVKRLKQLEDGTLPEYCRKLKELDRMYNHE